MGEYLRYGSVRLVRTTRRSQCTAVQMIPPGWEDYGSALVGGETKQREQGSDGESELEDEGCHENPFEQHQVRFSRYAFAELSEGTYFILIMTVFNVCTGLGFLTSMLFSKQGAQEFHQCEGIFLSSFCAVVLSILSFIVIMCCGYKVTGRAGKISVAWSTVCLGISVLCELFLPVYFLLVAPNICRDTCPVFYWTTVAWEGIVWVFLLAICTSWCCCRKSLSELCCAPRGYNASWDLEDNDY